MSHGIIVKRETKVSILLALDAFKTKKPALSWLTITRQGIKQMKNKKQSTKRHYNYFIHWNWLFMLFKKRYPLRGLLCKACELDQYRR